MKRIKYSIVVPAFNVETSIARCLDSLVRQGRKDTEIIVVDDGSTDNTLQIIKSYAKTYKNLKVIHQNNVGLAQTRKNGIGFASGEYCLVVDSDDWLEKDALSIINACLSRIGDIDVLKFKFIYDPSGKQKQDYFKDGTLLNDEEMEQIRRDLLLTSKYNNLCNQVFKRNLYNRAYKTTFCGINYGEDVIVNLGILGRAKRIVLINNPLYHYCDNMDSITHTVSDKTIEKILLDGLKVYEERKKYLTTYKISGVDTDMLKKTLLLSICDRIKQYMVNGGKDYSRIQQCLDKTNTLKVLDGVKIDGMKLTDKYICKCIITSRLHKLNLIRPCYTIKSTIRKTYYFFLNSKERLLKKKDNR